MEISEKLIKILTDRAIKKLDKDLANFDIREDLFLKLPLPVVKLWLDQWFANGSETTCIQDGIMHSWYNVMKVIKDYHLPFYIETESKLLLSAAENLLVNE